MNLPGTVFCLCVGLTVWPAALPAEAVILPVPEQKAVIEPLDLSTNLRPSAVMSGESLIAKEEPLASSTLFRDVPSLSSRYSIGGTTLLPFIGAGFGGGYSSERDRALNPSVSGLSDSGLRTQWNQLGQGFSPNEFHMGIRIPF